MKNNIPILILSILKIADLKFIENKIKTLENELTLNEVEKKIIKDIKENLHLKKIVDASFIKEKYSYYFDQDLIFDNSLFNKESIDSAITEVRISQLKFNLSNEFLNLGSQIENMTPQEIKEKLNLLYTNTLIESKSENPENSLVSKDDAYGEMTAAKEGLSLVVHTIEEYAGKATKGSIVSILAFTGGFKSTYALNLAYKNALRRL
jgi:hypothetical protein